MPPLPFRYMSRLVYYPLLTALMVGGFALLLAIIRLAPLLLQRAAWLGWLWALVGSSAVMVLVLGIVLIVLAMALCVWLPFAVARQAAERRGELRLADDQALLFLDGRQVTLPWADLQEVRRTVRRFGIQRDEHGPRRSLQLPLYHIITRRRVVTLSASMQEYGERYRQIAAGAPVVSLDCAMEALRSRISEQQAPFHR